MATITITLTTPRNRQTPTVQLARVSAVPLSADPLAKLGLTLSSVTDSIDATEAKRIIVLASTPFFDSAFPDAASRYAAIVNLYAGEHEIALASPITWAGAVT